jgi:hypothetical protein
MALEVRRIVTGHDANGKAVIKTDERMAAASRLGRPHIAGCEIWSTNTMPVDNSEASEAAQRKGFVTRYNYVGNGQGSVIRITEFAPGAPNSCTEPRRSITPCCFRAYAISSSTAARWRI